MGQLSLEGIGTITASPDTAHVVMSITTSAKNSKEALDGNNEQMAKLLSQLDALDIDRKRDVTTNHFSIRPIVRHDSHNNPLKKIDRWEAINSLSVQVRDLPALGDILSSTGELTRIGGLRFSNSQIESLLDEARIKAIEDAIRKAKIYAEAASITLGPITMLSEQDSHSQQQWLGMAARCTDVPIAEGENEHSVTVQVTFEIGS